MNQQLCPLPCFFFASFLFVYYIHYMWGFYHNCFSSFRMDFLLRKHGLNIWDQLMWEFSHQSNSKIQTKKKSLRRDSKIAIQNWNRFYYLFWTTKVPHSQHCAVVRPSNCPRVTLGLQHRTPRISPPSAAYVQLHRYTHHDRFIVTVTKTIYACQELPKRRVENWWYRYIIQLSV